MLTTSERLQAYLSLIEQQRHDDSNALELRAKLDEVLGPDHADLVRCDKRIAQIPMLKSRQTAESAVGAPKI